MGRRRGGAGCLLAAARWWWAMAVLGGLAVVAMGRDWVSASVLERWGLVRVSRWDRMGPATPLAWGEANVRMLGRAEREETGDAGGAEAGTGNGRAPAESCARAWLLEAPATARGFPWEEEPAEWEEARRVNEVVERRHREDRDAIVYFLHVHKGGGTTVCNSARMNSERTTQMYRQGDAGEPLDNFPDKHNCNVFWLVKGKEDVKLIWRDADPRLRGPAARQGEAADALGRVCAADDPRPPPVCGISFVANEFELPPPGEFIVGASRPWVYVAVVRDPLDLVLSNYFDSHRGREAELAPDAATFVKALEGRWGHLVAVFAGGIDHNIGEGAHKARLAEAVARLKHFSAVVDTTAGYTQGFSVLAHRLGWADENYRSGSHNSACTSQLPAFLDHSEVRARALALFKYDIIFYHVASAYAAHQFSEVEAEYAMG